MRLALGPHQASRIKINVDWLTMVESLAELREAGPFRDLSDLPDQIVGQGHTFHSSAGLQAAMKLVRHIAKLNHL